MFSRMKFYRNRKDNTQAYQIERSKVCLQRLENLLHEHLQKGHATDYDLRVLLVASGDIRAHLWGKGYGSECTDPTR